MRPPLFLSYAHVVGTVRGTGPGVAVGLWGHGARHVLWTWVGAGPSINFACMVDMKRKIAAALLIVCQLQTCRLSHHCPLLNLYLHNYIINSMGQQ